jgi:hypothetical protein
MVSPVTQPKSSDSNAAMTLPMSSGSPMRPSAVWAARGGMTSGWSANASFAMRSPGRPGSYGVHPDPAGAQLLGQAPSEDGQTTLHAGVGGVLESRVSSSSYTARTPTRSATHCDCQRRSRAKPPGIITSAACAAMYATTAAESAATAPSDAAVASAAYSAARPAARSLTCVAQA